GYQVPLPKAVLAKLYPTGRDYLTKVSAATRRDVAERWLTRADGQRVIAEAREAARRMDAERTARAIR
ncbi:MAG: alpha/beta hydrolase domain-containing protein, partial [Steroidobacteraceae bacterium]